MSSFTINSLSAYKEILESVSEFQTNSIISSSIIREHLDFSDFSNFIAFGSARFEVDNAILDIQENYPNFDNWNISASNLSITSNDEIVAKYVGWKNSTDPFTQYLVDNIKQYSVTATITGASYSTDNTDQYTYIFPWFDYNNPFTISQLGDISAWEVSGDDYDKDNMNSLLKMLPDIITNKDEDLKTLLNVIGHHFDDIHLIIKRNFDIYNFSYKLSEMPGEETLNAFIDSLGMGKFLRFTERHILEYYENTFNTSNEYSKKDFSKLLKVIFINNIMQVIKTKGTVQSIRAAENIFGWPKGLVNIEEYISVSNNIPASGIIIDVPEYQYKTNMIFDEYSSYNYNVNLSTNHSMTANHSFPNGLIFSFSLKNVQDLNKNNNYWLNTQKEIFNIKTYSTTNSTLSGFIKLFFDSSISGLVLSANILSIASGPLSQLLGKWNIPLTASKYSNIDDNTIFTIATGLSAATNMKVFFGTYYPSFSSPNANYDPSSISSSWLGSFVYDIIDHNSGVGATISADKLKSFSFLPNESINGLIPLSFKLYNNYIWNNIANASSIITSISNHVTDYEYFYRNGVRSSVSSDLPKLWYKFNNTNTQSSSSIINSAPFSNIWDRLPITSSNVGITKLIKRPLVFNKRYTYYAGDNIDALGIYPDISDLNNIKASNKLKVYISPSKIINDLIDRIINYVDIDLLYGKPEDLYKPRYSELTQLRNSFYSFLANYSNGNLTIDLSTFFKILQSGYSDNILEFITNNLIPAKSNIQSGLYLENDKLYDQKMTWHKPQSNDLQIEHTVKYEQQLSSEQLNLDATTNYNIKQMSEIVDKESIVNFNSNNILSENCHYEDDMYIPLYQSIHGEDTTQEITVFTNNNISTENQSYDSYANALWLDNTTDEFTYEHKYWYVNNLWKPNKDYQSNETNLVDLSGNPFYGMSKWISPSQSYLYEQQTDWINLAHLEESKLSVNVSSNNLFNEQNISNNLSINMSRYGFNCEGAYVNIKVPSKSSTNSEPIIYFNEFIYGDIYTTPITACNEYSLKLTSKGRDLSYILNIGSLTSTQAQCFVDFGYLGANKDDHIYFWIRSQESKNIGSAGNGLIFSIQLDESLQTDYAVAEVRNERQVIIKIAETPYIVYELVSALTSNPKVSELFSIDYNTLINASTSVTLGDDTSDNYRCNTFGDYYLNGGEDNSTSFLNKEYKIQIINIYNKNDSPQSFTVIPKVKSTMIDENKKIEEQFNT